MSQSARARAQEIIATAKARIAQRKRALGPLPIETADEYDQLAAAYDSLAESSSEPAYERRRAEEARIEAERIRNTRPPSTDSRPY